MKVKRNFCWLVCCLLLVFPTLSKPAQAVTETNSSLFNQEYAIPGAPLNLVVEAPGRVWFTMPEANLIGSLVISPTVTFTPYPVPTANSRPYDLLYHNEIIWFTERAGNKIGRLETKTGAFQEFTIPTVNSEPTGITLAPDGSLWFTEAVGNKIGRFDPVSATFVEYIYPTPGAKLEDIAMAGNDIAWVTAPDLNRVVTYDRTRNLFLDLFTGPQTRPLQVIVDEANLPWITTNQNSWIGRYAPGTLSLWYWYELPLTDSGATGIAFRFQDNQFQLWYTTNNNGGIGQLTTRPSGKPLAAREHYPLGPTSRPWGIAVDTAGHVWVASTGSNKIIEWRPPYFIFTHLAVIAKNHTH